MQKKKKCLTCGGAFIFNIPNSFFDREEHLSMKCPYCQLTVSFYIEDGKLIEESEAKPYLKNLTKKQIHTRPWLKFHS